MATRRFERLGPSAIACCGRRTLVEMMEIKNHPWMLGVQFHPEFKSRPINAHPLFREFIKASLIKGKKR